MLLRTCKWQASSCTAVDDVAHLQLPGTCRAWLTDRSCSWGADQGPKRTCFIAPIRHRPNVLFSLSQTLSLRPACVGTYRTILLLDFGDFSIGRRVVARCDIQDAAAASIAPTAPFVPKPRPAAPAPGAEVQVP